MFLFTSNANIHRQCLISMEIIIVLTNYKYLQLYCAWQLFLWFLWQFLCVVLRICTKNGEEENSIKSSHINTVNYVLNVPRFILPLNK